MALYLGRAVRESDPFALDYGIGRVTVVSGVEIVAVVAGGVVTVTVATGVLTATAAGSAVETLGSERAEVDVAGASTGDEPVPADGAGAEAGEEATEAGEACVGTRCEPVCGWRVVSA
jgi:hypothetical protein